MAGVLFGQPDCRTMYGASCATPESAFRCTLRGVGAVESGKTLQGRKCASAECRVSSGAAEFGDVAGAVERRFVLIRHWRGAVSGVVCQIQIVGIVHFPSGTRIKSLRTPNKSGL